MRAAIEAIDDLRANSPFGSIRRAAFDHVLSLIEDGGTQSAAREIDVLLANPHVSISKAEAEVYADVLEIFATHEEESDE
jgi:anti-sigma factor ChrR (cupin superfamily)